MLLLLSPPCWASGWYFSFITSRQPRDDLWRLLSSHEGPRWHLAGGDGLTCLGNLLSSIAAFMNDLSWVFWIICCSFCISTCCPTLCFFVMEMAS